MRGFEPQRRMFVWGCPCLRAGVDLAIGHKAESGVPLPWLRPRRCTMFVFAGPSPQHRLPATGLDGCRPHETGRVTTWRLIAQRNPASARAMAVIATVGCLPLRFKAG